MRTTRLAFNDLQNGFDVIARENLRSIKGGVEYSGGSNPFSEWISSQLGKPAITGQDAEGNLLVSTDGGATWMSVVFQLDSVSVTGIGNWNRPSMFTSVYDGFHASWADTYGVTYGLTGGGTGNTTPTPNNSYNFNDFLSSLVSTTSTSILSSSSVVNSNGFSGFTGLSTYTGTVVTPSNSNSIFILDTTFDNGNLSSLSLSLGNTASISMLAEGGFSFSYNLNGTSYSAGLSQTQGFLFGSSINIGSYTAGYEYNHIPGWGSIVLALSVIAALETGGGSLAAYANFAAF